MEKMLPEYAQRLLEGGYAFGNSFLSCHDDLLVVESDDFPYGSSYQGTQLVDGKLQLDEDGYVVFRRVEPVIDSETRFSHP